MEGMKDEELRCEPCEVLSAAGMLIGQFAVQEQDTVDELTLRITTGEMSIRELSSLLSADKEYLDAFIEDGLDVDAKIMCDNEGFCTIGNPEEKKEEDSEEEVPSPEEV